MEDNANENRRAYPRFHIHQLIEFQAAREEFVNATGVNISLGGILCETDEPVDPYSTVFLLLSLPQKDGSSYEMKTDGIVLRCSALGEEAGYKLGIQFTDTNSTDLQKIEEYIIAFGESADDSESE